MTGREKFEAWLTSLPGFEAADVAKGEEGKYNYRETEWCWKSWQAALASQQPADDDWIEWEGGECPVDEDTIVEMKWKYGDVLTDRAGIYQWSYYQYGDRIIAYRVVIAMSYIFLIVVIMSNTANQQVIPMDSMAQCNAALKAMELVKDKRTGWRAYNPTIDSAHCIEVKP